MCIPVLVVSLALIAVFALLAQSPEFVLRRQAVERERVRMERFEHRVTTGVLQWGAIFTGRTVLAAARSVYVRKHLVMEVLVVPSSSDGVAVNPAMLQLRVNGEQQPRLPQSPELVSSFIRGAGDVIVPRLQAGVGMGDRKVTWDSGPRPGARFPGDPRTPRPSRRERDEGIPKQDPLEADAAFVAGQAFRGGQIYGPASGYLYFSGDLDLRKITKLELLIFADGEQAPPAVLRLK